MTASTRRILLCATGLSPQIVTETLYALAVQDGWIPDEIHLITTVEGKQHALLRLLEDDPNERHFYRLCEDYQLDASAIRFNADTIHVIQGRTGEPLEDIRSRAENTAAADAIMTIVHELTADPDSVIHASIAGGRKTMGFFLGYAMSLFGREQDRLSHVLVSQPFETHLQFYYPPKQPRVLFDRNNKPHKTNEAEITLADIPYVRLRGHLDRGLLTEGANYSDAVRRTQRSLQPAELVLDAASRTLRCGDKTLTLAPTLFAFYVWFARRLLVGTPGIHWSQAGAAAEFLAAYATVVSPYSGDYAEAERSLAKGMSREFLDPKKAKINDALRDALGPASASDYQIQDLGKLPGTRYKLHGLALRPEQVRFAALS